MTPPRYAAVVLAAGMSTRAGTVNKLLLPFGTSTLLGCVLDAVRTSRVDEIIVVTGYQANRIRPLALSHLHGTGKRWRIVHAADYARGLSASLKAGIAAMPPDALGALVCLGDMPLVSPQVIDRLMKSRQFGDIAAVPTHQGKWGNPVLLARPLFPKVMHLTGDQGARPILKRSRGRIRLVEMADVGIETDIDTPEMLRSLG